MDHDSQPRILLTPSLFEKLVPVPVLEGNSSQNQSFIISSVYRQSYLEFQLSKTNNHHHLDNEFQTQPVSQGPLGFGPGLSCFIDCLFTSVYASLGSLISCYALNSLPTSLQSVKLTQLRLSAMFTIEILFVFEN